MEDRRMNQGLFIRKLSLFAVCSAAKINFSAKYRVSGLANCLMLRGTMLRFVWDGTPAYQLRALLLQFWFTEMGPWRNRQTPET